jgi:hypothetical protein
MQFFYMTDQFTGIEHTYLILPLTEKQFESMKKVSDEIIPLVTCSAMIRKGHPCIVFDYGIMGDVKSTLPLDEVFESGERLGDKFKVVDVLTVILTAKPQDKVITSSKEKVTFNVSLDEIIAFSFSYTLEMEEIYAFYNLFQRVKQGERANPKTRKRKTA